ncbi:MAG: SPASM domain-containing protein, partial [bacterium]|nr:SPASM domain-containing protein [bacterium]
FGGEPLLRRELIIKTIESCGRLSRERGLSYHSKVTTNGLLLDENFMEYAASTGLQIALSFDGIKEAHDRHRKDRSGQGTYDTVYKKAKLLLSYQPYASALMVVTPETVSFYRQSVEHLFETGFRYVVASLNYAAPWGDADIRELKRQYMSLADLYEEMTLAEKKFYFSPFEVKLATHIKGDDALCDRCHFAQRQISIAPDGSIYPCVQFVGDGVSNKRYCIGNIRDGLDETYRGELFEQSRDMDEVCTECALNARCNNRCSCLNWQSTGLINKVSPVLCANERMLIPITDKLGERLYKRRAPLFIQKHYNAVYPVLSLLDDMY